MAKPASPNQRSQPSFRVEVIEAAPFVARAVVLLTAAPLFSECYGVPKDANRHNAAEVIGRTDMASALAPDRPESACRRTKVDFQFASTPVTFEQTLIDHNRR